MDGMDERKGTELTGERPGAEDANVDVASDGGSGSGPEGPGAVLGEVQATRPGATGADAAHDALRGAKGGAVTGAPHRRTSEP